MSSWTAVRPMPRPMAATTSARDRLLGRVGRRAAGEEFEADLALPAEARHRERGPGDAPAAAHPRIVDRLHHPHAIGRVAPRGHPDRQAGEGAGELTARDVLDGREIRGRHRAAEPG